jgi:hypothetical protein
MLDAYKTIKGIVDYFAFEFHANAKIGRQETGGRRLETGEEAGF